MEIMLQYLHVRLQNQLDLFMVWSDNFNRIWAGRSMAYPCPISFSIFINTVMNLTRSAISDYFSHKYVGLFRRVFAQYFSGKIGWNAKGRLS
jgi:hypothetical protein